MTIAELRDSCKSALASAPRDALLLALVLLVALLSFGLGYMAGQGAQAPAGLSIETSPAIDTSLERRVVASRSGTAYYFAWCGGASRILEGNKVRFDSAAQAQAAGYTSAANCSGL